MARAFMDARAPRPDPTTADRTDVGTLFATHGAFLLRTAERLCGHAGDAEDIVQEAFLIAHQKSHLLPGDVEWRAWLYRVVVNLVAHNRRSVARRLRLQDAAKANPPQPFSGADAVERSRQARVIRAAVLSLPLKHRTVFVAYELEGLDGDDVASLLDIPINTVWTRLHKARALFKNHCASGREATGSEP